MARLPESYAALTFPDIKLYHHPRSSPTATKIIIVELHRPAARNAFTTQMSDSLVRAFNTLSLDPRVKAVVLTGSDPKNRVFCTGMDLAFSGEAPADALEAETRETHRDGGGRASLAIYNCSKPVIAAINGSAVGVGITMTLPANIRVISRDAKVGFVFARRGLVMEACSSFFLPRLIGSSKALHLATTGAVYPPDHTLLRDLFGEIVAPDEVLPRALALAEEVAVHTSTVSTRVNKDLIYRGPGTPEGAHAVESKVLFDLFRGQDFMEGVMSFKEKRTPAFEGTLEDDAPRVWPWWEWSTIKDKSKI
ncbi:enoyl-CoA hydratase/isomerase [Thozetella sp. PMI_491]|nr:enoyl-CoA hydratase/isomerase [Thozetella sp. PMI_491]